MTSARQDRLIAVLLRADDWMTASTLADLLGVTPRTVRSYVTAINARSVDGEAIASGPQGYRAQAAAATLRASSAAAGTPRDRLHTIVRALLDTPTGVDLEELSRRLFVSDSTLDADLVRVRALLAGTDLVLERSASIVRLRGTEMAQRRLLSRLAQDEMDAGAMDLHGLRRALGSETLDTDAFGPFKTDLVAELGALGYYVNELGIADVVTHIAITVDRVARGYPLDAVSGDADPRRDTIGARVNDLTRRHFGLELGVGDGQHLATLVLTRVVAPDARVGPDAARSRIDPEILRVVGEVIASASEAFVVDLADEDFEVRLALHVQNLVHRARQGAFSRNPLTWSLKSSYPMIYEIAVFIASALHDRLDIEVQDDEIAYIAMHVGGRLERARSAEAMLSATIVCPGYYELNELLRSSVDRSLGLDIEVVGVDTRMDPAWEEIGTDLVLTTIDPPVPADHIVRIQPFLGDADVERVRTAAARVRRGRRLHRLRDELQRYVHATAYINPLADAGEETIIRSLGATLVAEGIIDEDYVERTIERERMSSTAFSDALAVPHALDMSATRTAIAFGIADGSVAWGPGRVHVVAMVAFSQSDREAFQTVFEQLVEVFSERDSVQRILRRSADFGSFLDELASVVDG